MFKVILNTSGPYKDLENEIVKYSFRVDGEYTHKGFPAIKVKQQDDSGITEFNVCQTDYLSSLIEAVSFIEKRAWLEDCEVTLEGYGFFLLQPDVNIPFECNFNIHSVNEKIIDDAISSPYFCEINITNLFNKFRIYGITPFQAFKSAAIFLSSIIRL